MKNNENNDNTKISEDVQCTVEAMGTVILEQKLVLIKEIECISVMQALVPTSGYLSQRVSNVGP